MRNKVLALIKLPPPHTGATAMNQLAMEVFEKNSALTVLDLSYRQSVGGLGKFSVEKFFQTIYKYWLFLKLLITKKFDLIYFQISPLGFAFYRDCYYVLIAKLLRKKLLLHLHGKGIKELVSNKRLKFKLYKWVFKNSGVITLSDKTVCDLDGLISEKPHILPNCLPQADLNVKSHPKEFDFMFLSNLLYSKGIIVYLEALSLLKKQLQSIDFKAVIIGKDADLDAKKLNVEIQKRGLTENVEYVGGVFGIEKFDYYSKSKVFVFPTLNDIWGLVILEAFSQSVPVIASNDGAISEMVQDGITGKLIAKGDVETLVKAMKESIDNPEKWIQMGLKGKEKFESEFTRDRFEKKLIEIMQICITKNEFLNS